jgi:hypothetical protein
MNMLTDRDRTGTDSLESRHMGAEKPKGMEPVQKTAGADKVKAAKGGAGRSLVLV